MDRERAKELLPFIQALAEGKTIQVLGVDGKWHDELKPDFILKVENYCIKPEAEVKLMTHRQLAEWCAKGNGQYIFKDSQICCNEFTYAEEKDYSYVNGVLIRRWGEGDWIVPTKDIYLDDCSSSE